MSKRCRSPRSGHEHLLYALLLATRDYFAPRLCEVLRTAPVSDPYPTAQLSAPNQRLGSRWGECDCTRGEGQGDCKGAALMVR